MSQPNQPPTVADLHRAAQRNPLIAAHLAMWRQGEFPTFEQCLVSIAVELARVNEQLTGCVNPWRDKYKVVRKEAKLDAEAVEKISAAPFAGLDADVMQKANAAMQKRCAKLIQDMMYPTPPKPFTTEGKSIERPDDFEPPAIVGSKPGE